MQTIWLTGLTEDQAKAFKDVLKNNQTLIQQVLKILSNKAEAVERKGYKEEDYDLPDWYIRQAFRNGKLAAYQEIAEMFLSINKEKSKL